MNLFVITRRPEYKDTLESLYIEAGDKRLHLLDHHFIIDPITPDGCPQFIVNFREMSAQEIEQHITSVIDRECRGMILFTNDPKAIIPLRVMHIDFVEGISHKCKSLYIDNIREELLDAYQRNREHNLYDKFIKN
jgi:hypothetical protein